LNPSGEFPEIPGPPFSIAAGRAGRAETRRRASAAAARKADFAKDAIARTPPGAALAAVLFDSGQVVIIRTGGCAATRIRDDNVRGEGIDSVSSVHGVVLEDSRFWVTHRRRRYGPFDYEWSKDFAGIEMTYEGRKFGEYCSRDEIDADLKEFRLPSAVVQVATIVMGCLVYGVLNGLSESERSRMMRQRLCATGLERFAPRAE
jgi:hypothetical protein